MRTTIRKWYFVWHEEKERKFLEEKAAGGLRLVSIGFGRYVFETASPTQTVYQMDFKGIDTRISEADYLQLYADAGWSLACRYGGWYYFYQEVRDGDVDLSIFNNNESRLAKYKRLLLVLLLTGFPLYYNMVILFPNLPSSSLEFPNFYFFFRIFSLLISLLHAGAVVKVFIMYHRMKKQIRE